MSDATRESSNDPSADDTPTGDPLRVGRGLVEDESESGDTSGRSVTDDGALDQEFIERHEHDSAIHREGGPNASLAKGGLGAHVMDSDGIDTHDE
jgi:hypothetical protein